jgi:hypothetical protein
MVRLIKKGLLLFIVLLSFRAANAQQYDKVWAVGPSITMMGLSADSVVLSKFVNDTSLSCFLTVGSICDSSGHFLFCTNGISINNRFGDLMPNGDSLSAPSEYYDQVYPAGMPSREGVVILPKPGDTNLYYIFHYTPTDSIDPIAGGVALNLYYSIVDMQQDNGKGAVVSKNIPIIQNELLSWSRMAACKHANGRDWWIIKNAWHTNIYYEFLLTPNGVLGPYIQQFGPSYDPPENEQPAYSLFNPDGTKYVSFAGNSNIVVMDFDRCSGLFSNPTSFFNSDSYDPINNPLSGGTSAAFSADGRFLYITNSLELNQYDLSSTSIHDSVRIETLTDTNDFYHMDILQLAPNGKIYISCYNGGSYAVSVINQPDSFGLACDFHLYGQPTLSQSPVAIPYFPNFRLGALDGSCDTIHTNITDIEDAHPIFASVSPNPVSDQAGLFYSTNSNSQNRAEIFDMTGNLIWNSNTVGSSGNINIDLSAMAAGIYMIRFTADDKVLLNTKLVLEK